jgi:hypothetical protein
MALFGARAIFAKNRAKSADNTLCIIEYFCEALWVKFADEPESGLCAVLP